MIVLWASSFVAARVALRDLAPGPLALARYGVAAIVFLALLALRRRTPPRPADLARLALSGALGITLYNLALNTGQQTVGAGIASLLVNTVPIWTSLLAVAFLRERMGAMQWCGGLVSFAGVALISLGSGASSGFSTGALWILAAALSQAAYFVLIKPLLTRYHPIDVTAYAAWFGFLFLLPYQSQLIDSARTMSAATIASVAFLGVGPAALAYIAWSYVLERTPANQAASWLFLVPVVALALGALVLGERPSLVALTGGAIALFGVGLSRGRRR